MNETNQNNERRSRTNLRRMTVIALMTALTCIIAPFSIPLPFTGVPISFTNLVIYLSVYLLGTRDGTLSYIIYLLLGFGGLPVFSGFTGGIGKLAGPTGGYLIGFIFLALICGLFSEKFRGNRWLYIVGMLLGLSVAYALGTVWLAAQAHLSFGQALFAGVIPFLLGDALKIAAITVVAPLLKKLLVRSGVLA